MISKSILVVVIVCVMAVANVASSTIIRGIEIDFVTIANPGNVGELSGSGAGGYGPDRVCGVVDYEYRICKYEVTNGQWNAFVSAAGAPTGNPSSAYDENPYWNGTNIPTNNVSWYEALQFCNYLTSGDKSQGAYQFSGDNSNPGDFLGIDRDLAVSVYGIAYVIPTEDEWYKAAYYTVSGYSTYANGTDTAPVAGTDTNYDWAVGQPWNVGNGTQEQNGTFDMMGNVWEWNETEWDETQIGSRLSIRGGSYEDDHDISSPYRYNYNLDVEGINVGFRVASVPEPSILLLLGLGGILLRKRHKA